jgi:predicted transcriptional regulator
LTSKKQAVKRVQVSFSKSQWEIIERLKEAMGDTDADVVRNIVLAWLAEKSIIAENVKRKIEAEK